MTILAGDIKIFQSDTMADVPEGGGSLTGNVVISGQSNNMFDDISTLDRVFGAVHLRKAFAQVFTQNVDKYYGSHIIIAQLPEDTQIGMHLFDTNDWFDRRPAAQSKIENYLAQGAKYSGSLWATQFAGSLVVAIYQSPSSPIPIIGDAIVLKDSSNTQFVRIVDITDLITTFEDSKGFYEKRILTLEISDNLLFDFVGSEMNRVDSFEGDAQIFNTVVTNAAKYYSSRPSAEIAVIDDLSITVDSVFSQLVPSAQSEFAVLDQTVGREVSATEPSDATTGAEVTLSLGNNFTNQNEVFQLPSSVKPGSFKINGSFDDGEGNTAIGNINYVTGEFDSSTTPANNAPVEYIPAGKTIGVASSFSLPVNVNNRGKVWTTTIKPNPAEGTVIVSFRALGKWYDLVDDGTGTLKGSDISLGSGIVTYATGATSITLGFLPDIGSDIIITSGTRTTYLNRADAIPSPVTVIHTIGEEGVDPSSVIVTWNDGAARTATCGINGLFTGDATGTFDVTNSKIRLVPNNVPLQGSSFSVAFSFGATLEQDNTTFGAVGFVMTIDLGVTNVLAGSVRLSYNGLIQTGIYDNPTNHESVKISVMDDGVGGIQSLNGTTAVGSSINYATGIITIDGELSMPVTRNKRGYRTVAVPPFETRNYTSPFTPILISDNTKQEYFSENYQTTDYVDNPVTINIKYRTAAANAAPAEVFTLSSIAIELTDGFDETVVEGSMVYNLSGEDYFDSNGSVVKDPNMQTGSAISVGGVDYVQGIFNLTSWVGGGLNNGKIKSLLTSLTDQAVNQITFRIDVAPVKVQSLSIRYKVLISDGVGIEQVATADIEGIISGVSLEGYINWETGVVSLSFGDRIIAVGTEDWYNANNINLAGEAFRPAFGQTDSIFYQAVGIIRTPLDASILGLNPVRLPSDGTVPIYSKGDVVVILNEKETVGTYVDNEVVDVGRLDLSKLTVRDSAGNVVSSSAYAANLDTGIVTMGDLTGINQPLTLVDRVEDMAVLNDVEITGQLGLSAKLKHDYPIAGTLVCNALVTQDLFARTSIPFDQQTWTNEWSDVLIGSEVLAQFNHAAFPILVDNATAITERWALIFTSDTDFDIIGENVGVIGTGNITTNTSPVNILTGGIYWTINFLSLGVGWAAGNVIRFNSFGAGAPFWLIQSVSQGDETSNNYTSCVEIRGDKSAI